LPRRSFRPRPSFLQLADRIKVGDAHLVRGELMVVTELSRPFKDDDIGSIGGEPYWEDEWVVRAFYRPATAEEIAAFDAERAEAADLARRQQATDDAVRAVFAGPAGPDLGRLPRGEVIWENDSSGLVGWTRTIITDGIYLYGITYDGSDGGTWGDFNYGQNSRGTRIPYDPALVSALRGEAVHA
jgi:hypothetical protein